MKPWVLTIIGLLKALILIASYRSYLYLAAFDFVSNKSDSTLLVIDLSWLCNMHAKVSIYKS